MIYVKIGETTKEATVNGYRRDPKWDYRDVEEITITATADEAVTLFPDGVEWELVQTFEPYLDEETGEIIQPEDIVHSHREFCVSGAVTDHRNGKVTIRMGKLTEVEQMQKQLANAITEEELEAAYVEGVNSL